MIHAHNRVTFRMTDLQKRRYEMLFKVGSGFRRVYTWTDLVLAALQELWLKQGSPEPPAIDMSDKRARSRPRDLFSFTPRRSSAATSSPAKPRKRKRVTA